MSAFEEALRRSVAGLEKGFKQAMSDLFEETQAASESVSHVTNGAAHLVLQPFEQDAERSSFVLYVADRNNLSDVEALQISSREYPIQVAASSAFIKIGLWEEVIQDRAGIRKHFTNLATNADSRLVLRIAFLLRQRERASGAVEETNGSS